MSLLPITVDLNDQKQLDIGSYVISNIPSRNGVEYRIMPPSTPIFAQVVEYLWSQPELPYSGYQKRFLAVGFTALAVRWGSYFAALCAPEFPMYEPNVAAIPDVQGQEISQISDSEMKRLNIEISANIAALGKLYQEDYWRFYDLIDRAYEYLPMPIKSVRPNYDLRNHISIAHAMGSLNIYMAKNPEKTSELLSSLGIHDEINRNPTLRPIPGEADRVIGNFLANAGWRNTVVERYHAGWDLNVDAPLLPAQRRFSQRDERILIKTLSSKGYEILRSFLTLYDSKGLSSEPRFHFIATYPESASALINAGYLAMYPNDWSTTEQSYEVILSHYDRSEKIS